MMQMEGKYGITVADQSDDGGNIANVMLKWKSDDRSDKEVYKVDVELGKYITKLYNTVETSTLTSDKEIYKLQDTGDFPDFIVLENNTIYLSTNLSNKILEGTYTVNANNTIKYNVLKENQDYEFYTSSTLRFENIYGEKHIVIENNDLNEEVHYQKVH